MLENLKGNLSLAPINLKLLLYKIRVPTKLEYAASIWGPCQDNNISDINGVQNRSVRFILSNYRRISCVTSVNTTLSLPNLALRRSISTVYFIKYFVRTLC